ncbi:MAG TPA: ribosome small subunit-dependent GTPase A [Egibacteraceae bacterium]|nr:ribosome small subunit-dependent GTPase A [Egibacteraceae bacterium]
MTTDALPPDLIAYGWDAGWAEAFALATAGDAESVPARVARVDRGACTAAGEGRSYRVQLLPRTEWPVTGDWLAVRPSASERELDQVAAVLPRRKALRRMDADERRSQLVAANVDVVLAVIPLDRPFKPGLRDRLLVLAAEAQAEPVLVLSKADIADPVQLAVAESDAPPGFPQLVVSAARGEGVEAVRDAIGAGRTAVLLGPSGAGKSTLANALVGQDVQRTGEVREGDRKGRHTTTARELMPLPGGGVLMDTPGVRALGLWDADEGIEEVFADIAELAQQCRFGDCAHDSEPGCAVRQAIEDGELDADRFARWRALLDEVEAQERRRVEHERRAHERAFSRHVRDTLKRKGRK